MSEFARQTERDAIIADARSSEGKSPSERMEIFMELLAVVDAVWAHLPAEERRRRMQIADELHRRPDPWWKNVRRDALPDEMWNR